MTLQGVRTTNIDNSVAVADELLVNRLGVTGLITILALATQLAGTGAIADALDDIRGLATGRGNFKDPVRAAATVNVALTAIIPGAGFSGVVLAAGDRVGLTNQTSPAANGIYVVNSSGAATRALDADTATEVAGMAFFVTSGTLAGKAYICSASNVTLNTTALPFALYFDISSQNANLLAHIADVANPHKVTADQVGLGSIQTRALSGDWIFAVPGPFGGVALGVRDDGSVYPGVGRMSLSGDWLLAVVGQFGGVVFGVRDDLTIYPTEAAADVMAYVSGGRVWIEFNGQNVPLTDTGTFVGEPDVKGNNVRWLENTGTAIVRQTANIAPQSSLLSTVSDLVHFPGDGQSLLLGINESPSVFTTDAVRPGRAVMDNIGLRSLGTSQGSTDLNTVLAQANMLNLVDLKETLVAGAGETGFAQVARLMTDPASAYPATTGMLISLHGISGQSYDNIKAGTVPWKNTLANIRRGALVAALTGKTFKVPGWFLIQAEADRLLAYQQRYDQLMEMHANADAATKAITGQTDTIKIILDQFSSMTINAITRSEVPLAHLQVALDHPDKFICIGPKYHLTYDSQGLHPVSASYRDRGEEVGEAMVKAYFGAGHVPLHPVSAVRTGTVIEITFAGGVGNLVKEASLVSDPGNGGIVFVQTGGTAKTLSGLTITGANKATINISAVPDGTNPFLEFGLNGVSGNSAGPTTGPRTILRDSNTTTYLDGRPKYNWCCHSRVAITT